MSLPESPISYTLKPINIGHAFVLQVNCHLGFVQADGGDTGEGKLS